MQEVEDIVHGNRVAILHALHALNGQASIREVHIFLHRHAHEEIDLPSILYHLKNLESIVKVSERDPPDGHTVEGVPPHDVKITDDALVDTILWAHDN